MSDTDYGTLSVEMEGRRFEMKFGDFSAKDELDFERATGRNLMSAFVNGQFDGVCVAGMLWLVRRRHEKNLNFEKMAAKFKWRDMLGTMDFQAPDEDDDDEDGFELTAGDPDPEGNGGA